VKFLGVIPEPDSHRAQQGYHDEAAFQQQKHDALRRDVLVEKPNHWAEIPNLFDMPRRGRRYVGVALSSALP
jgi:hypothetical protein